MSSVKAISKHNGGVYTIGEAKFKSEPNDWTLVVEEEEIKPKKVTVATKAKRVVPTKTKE